MTTQISIGVSKMEKNLTDYLEDSPILIGNHYQDQKAVFSAVAGKVDPLGWISADFEERVLQREEEFPTGIHQGEFGVAIPHTDAECVNNEFIAFVLPKTPVPFKRMDDPAEIVEAEFIFVLGLNQPHQQLFMLQNLMQLIQNSGLLKELRGLKSSEAIINLLRENGF